MKNLACLILVWVLIVPIVSAQQNTEKTGALLWKISGNGLNRPSYIFGTHHLYPISFLDSIPGVKKAFGLCEQVVGEILMNDMATLAAEVQKSGMMPPDTSYQMLLSTEDYRFLDEQLISYLGAGMPALGMFKPAMISITFSSVFYQKIYPQVIIGEAMDLWFQQQAQAINKSVVGLESVQDQIDAIINIASLKRQAQDLICGLRNTDYMEAQVKKLHQYYRLADLSQISRSEHDDLNPCPSSEAEQSALNKNRNQRWLEKLPTMMAGKSCFIAVGCMHIAGEDGLLTGLEKMGYLVEAVK